MKWGVYEQMGKVKGKGKKVKGKKGKGRKGKRR
jgi:hypothetical protein